MDRLAPAAAALAPQWFAAPLTPPQPAVQDSRPLPLGLSHCRPGRHCAHLQCRQDQGEASRRCRRCRLWADSGTAAAGRSSSAGRSDSASSGSAGGRRGCACSSSSAHGRGSHCCCHGSCGGGGSRRSARCSCTAAAAACSATAAAAAAGGATACASAAQHAVCGRGVCSTGSGAGAAEARHSRQSGYFFADGAASSASRRGSGST